MAADSSHLDALRHQMSEVNREILNHLMRFFRISKQIGREKDRLGLPHFDPEREAGMLIEIQRLNSGEVSQESIAKIFKVIFDASVTDMGSEARRQLNISRSPMDGDRIIESRGIAIGGALPVVMAGPCAVESWEQIRDTAAYLSRLGIRFLRGGAYKPRSSPYSFQGLGGEGLQLLRRAADIYDMSVVTEVMDVESVADVEALADILQVGTRNMHNYSLLKRVGQCQKPVFLKRGLMSTIEEFIMAAEYVYLGGNEQIILCERGIRTFETETRNTLDISAVPILKQKTVLPVVVDISHSTGRKDITAAMARASLAAGADGIMVESHINPAVALSDANQQLNPEEMKQLMNDIADMVAAGSGG